MTVGVHLKNARASIIAAPVLGCLIGLPKDPRFRYRIDVNENGWRSLTQREPGLPAILANLVARNDVVVSVHDRFDDRALWNYLDEIDVAILPYAWGTHSGWAEACLDKGVRVVAPQTTCIPDQHSAIVPYSSAQLDQLFPILTRIYEERLEAHCWTLDERVAQQRQISARHEMIYRDLLAR
jgi:hypothetical protein